MGYGLERAHEAELLIMREIDRICRAHGLKYMMDSGTLLGAVRHGGFIPWDDDADVAMTRMNFEAFKRAAAKELPENMRLVLPDQYRGGKAFFDFTPRIVLLNSRMRADSGMMDFYEGKLNHLWVDIFILDRLPKCPAAAAVTKLMQKAVYGMAMGHRYELDFGKYSLANKIFVKCLSALGRRIPMPAIFKAQEIISVKDWRARSGLWYYSNYQPDYLYVTLQAEWCEKTVDMAFEGESFMAPKGWDRVLTCVYGDYMTPPPEEKRVPSHSDQDIEILPWGEDAKQPAAGEVPLG